MNAKYRFSKHTFEALRNGTVIQLRKDGFSATREYDRENNNELIVTNASPSQVRLAAGLGWVIND